MTAIFFFTPWRFSASTTASQAIATGMSLLATARMRFFRSSPHCGVPPHTDSAEMPRMKALGLASMARPTASSSDRSIRRNSSSKSSLLRTGMSSIAMRARWLVTPGGRMSSYSGCTTVLVDGVATPNASRQAR